MPMKVRYTTINGEVIAENRGGVRKQYVPDPLGSTVALLDSTATVTDTFRYWPYGEVASRTGTTPTPLQFVGTRGYYSDSTSRSYVRARSLATQVGRWMTQDPIGSYGGWNWYRYSNGSPTTLSDRTGHAPSECCDSNGQPLPCSQICKNFAGNPGNDTSGGGGVICCGSTKCACLFPGPDLPGYTPGECPNIDNCLLAHEMRHFPENSCDSGSGLHRPKPGESPLMYRLNECRARKENMDCLLPIMIGPVSKCQSLASTLYNLLYQSNVIFGCPSYYMPFSRSLNPNG